MKIKSSELLGVQLDYSVARAEGYNPVINPYRFGSISYGIFESELGYAIENYSTKWAQGGPIIERELIMVGIDGDDGGWEWEAEIAFADTPYTKRFGPTPLVAAMRCYVDSKLGDEVEIPNELMGK